MYSFADGRLTATSASASAHCSARSGSRSYDANGYESQVVDFNGNKTATTYNAKGQLQTEVLGSTTSSAKTVTYTWDSGVNRPLTVTVSGDNQTTYTYTTDNRVATVTRKNLAPYGTANQTHAWTYTYTKYASGIVQKLVVQGPLGTTDLTTYNYSSTGDLTSVTNPLGQTTTYSGYNSLGQVGTVTGPNGDITSYAYYPGGKLKSITTYPNGSSASTASFTYSSGLLATSAVNGITTTYTYDSARRLLSESHPELNGTETTQYTYNAASDRTRIDIYRNSTLRSRQYIDYDELSRVIARRGNNGQNVAYAYDNNGNVKTITDSLGRVTTLSYDPLNRLISSKDPKNGYTKFYYDNANRVTKIVDPRYLATTYSYDGFGQLWSESSPDRGTTTYAYTTGGLLTQMKRANNAITSYIFDGYGRPAQISAGGQHQTYAYDTCTNGKGRLCSVSLPNSTVQYTYEPDGRVRSRTEQITAGTSSNFTTGYAYDSYGRLTTLTYPNGQTANYTWSSNQISGMTTTIGGVTSTVMSSISYEPFGAVAGWTSGNGIVTSRGFDTNPRQTSLLTTAGATTLQNLGYGYNANDLITSITNGVDSGNSKSFGYDELSRLLTDTGASYTYDANGNRLTASGGVTYTIGSASNRLTATNALGASTFLQDAMGNTTTYAISGAGTVNYNYDAFNRMSSVSFGGSTLGSYAYNALGQRTSKVAGSTTDRYAYGEDWRLLGERRDGTNAWTNYLWFGGQPVAVTKGSTLYMLHDDHLGRPELATNASKTVVWKSANGTFGGQNVSTNTFGGLNLGLPGQYFDAESGLWYNVNRYYDPLMGRYTQVDPIGLGAG
jgi:RHS repeat-associated protein